MSAVPPLTKEQLDLVTRVFTEVARDMVEGCAAAIERTEMTLDSPMEVASFIREPLLPLVMDAILTTRDVLELGADATEDAILERARARFAERAAQAAAEAAAPSTGSPSPK